MNILDSFKKINLNSSGPAVSISSYGLTFNKTVVEETVLSVDNDPKLDKDASL